MTTCWLPRLLVLPVLLGLIGCPESGTPDNTPAHKDHSDVIRKQYVDRERTVEESMEKRLNYQVKPSGDAIDNPYSTLTPEQLQAKLIQTREALDQLPDDAPVNPELVQDLTTLTLISLSIDREKLAQDYERGVAGLQRALDSMGRFGDMRGGIMRSTALNQAFAQAAYTTALNGDDRLRSHPYFAFAPYWFIHRIRPDGEPYLTHEISAEDARTAKLLTFNALAYQALLYPSPEIRWWFENMGQEESLSGLAPPQLNLGNEELPENYSPPTYGLYPHAGVLFWRSSWQPDADALLARGAVENDPNSKLDAGQISWIAHGDPVLIQAAADALVNTIAQGSASDEAPANIPAHNVLRVGDTLPEAGRAPIITRELGPTGGNLRIDASDLYPQLSQWHRDLFWEAQGEIRVIDTIRYAFGQRDRTVVYWHLSATEPVELQADRTRTIVEWEEAAVVIQGNSPLEITQYLVPDGPELDSQHIVLRLRTIGRPPSLRILTRVLPRESSLSEAN